MRFSLSLWLPAVACLAQAATETGHLMVFPAQSRTKAQHRQIAPDTARVLLASVMGLDKFHEFGQSTQEKLDLVNVFQQQDTFASQQSAPVQLILTYGEKALEILDAQSTSSMQQFDVSPIPPTKKTEQLFDDLVTQDKWMEEYAGYDWRQNTFLKIVAADVEMLPERLSQRMAQGYDIYVLHMPSHFKGLKHATYGAYSLPSASHSYLHKRSQQEIPIEVSSFSSPDLAALASSTNNTNSTVLRGILPACFPSLSSCESMTRNCTGHGSCQLKFTDKDASSNGARCYQCACSADVRTNKDGTKKTTKWGGPACQKKDVVAPFWLLAGFSVGLMFLISWAIGNLLTMGGEDLPSVIGAGVSGVPRR